jgi:hypothetical protein
MFRDSGEADNGAIVEPLLPVGHVRHDFRDRMWKAARFRVRLVVGEPLKDRARPEMDAFTTEHAGQQIRVVGPVECGHHSIVPCLGESQATYPQDTTEDHEVSRRRLRTSRSFTEAQAGRTREQRTGSSSTS